MARRSARRLRSLHKASYTYMLLVTAGTRRATGRGPVRGRRRLHPQARRRRRAPRAAAHGERIVQLERTLQAKVKELEESAAHVAELQGMIPICMHCKRIRNQEQIWEKVETYIEHRSEARFSHALCASVSRSTTPTPIRSAAATA